MPPDAAKAGKSGVLCGGIFPRYNLEASGMKNWKLNDLRKCDVEKMDNVPWSVDNSRIWVEDQNPAAKRSYPRVRGEQIPSILKDGGRCTSRIKGTKRARNTILDQIVFKESLENQVRSVKVVARYEGIKNEQPADAGKRKKRKNRGSRPRTVR